LKLSFHGADRSVTGSCHLVECAGKRILIDCGLHQGSRELDEENSHPFGFDPASIDYVLLTHAHLDHCGRLPLLDKGGFRGEIITTGASRELARLVLLDAAHLQEEDARYRARIAARRGSTGQTIAPLYSVLDALNSFDHYGRTAVYDEPIELAAGVRATFINAGHILGSRIIRAFSRARNERFREGDVFRRVFERSVEACIASGLVGGEGFAVDASLIQADANKQRSITGQDWRRDRDPARSNQHLPRESCQCPWDTR
jgi:hypothetical protein